MIPSRPELEDKLCEAVECAQARLKRAKLCLAQFFNDMPADEGAERIAAAGNEKIAARRALDDAVKSLHQLTLHGKLPDDA